MVAQEEESLWEQIRFNQQGLVPAIALCERRRCVLMQAWMNREAIELTLSSGEVTYFSRSRGAIWRKGETSGNKQKLNAMYIDCDGDSLLLVIEQTGCACHTGHASCFYRRVDSNGVLLSLEHS